MVVYLIWAHFFDRAKATGNCLDGYISKIDSIYTDSVKSGGTRNLDYYAHITIEDGTKIVERIYSNRKYQAGMAIQLREFKSEIRGVKKYQISNCN